MSRPQPVFLALDQVLRLHRRSLEEHGGIDGARDPGAIESALASAQNTWFYREADLFEIAATYAFHLAESQAFFDGNKRAAIASALTFLELNGAYVQPNQDELYAAMIAIANRQLDKAGLAAVLRKQFPPA
jgi:death-on-curing protein